MDKAKFQLAEVNDDEPRERRGMYDPKYGTFDVKYAEWQNKYNEAKNEYEAALAALKAAQRIDLGALGAREMAVAAPILRAPDKQERA